ncbi:MAG: hypothetical protein ACK52I_23940, partial [Pseudomonadota bacterium]
MPILPKLMFNSAIKLSTGLAIVLAANSALAERLSGTLQAQPPELIEDDSILARQPYSSRGEQLALGGIE